MIRCDIRATRWSDLRAALLPARRPSLVDDARCVPVHSGKAGISHVFSFLRSSKVLQDRNSQVLVPPWLGYWVYNAIRPHGNPVLHDDPEVKAAFVYHQYGFPQDLDKIRERCRPRGVAVVEDCAHALEGRYKGRPLGTESLAGVFSFSKFYPSLIAGAVLSSDQALRDHVAKLDAAGSGALALFSFGVKLALQDTARATRETGLARRLNEFAYAGYPYSRRLAWTEKICGLDGINDETHRRRSNYRLYRELLSDHEELQALEADAVPHVLPLMHPRRENLVRMAKELREMGFDTGVYAFDANRNMFDARYVPCLWLPVHGGIDAPVVARIVEAVRRHR